MEILARACLLEVVLWSVAVLEHRMSRPSSDGGSGVRAPPLLLVVGLTEHVAINATFALQPRSASHMKSSCVSTYISLGLSGRADYQSDLNGRQFPRPTLSFAGWRSRFAALSQISTLPS